MDTPALRALAGPWPGVTEDVKWGQDLVFSVGGKMFCCTSRAGPAHDGMSFKVEAERFLEFTDRRGFRPAPYLARAHWVRLDDVAAVQSTELEAMIRRSYELVRGKLSKRLQRELAD
ncbi:MAG: MmcQ/YjbR family DNA-binding protein [Gammaproteobacteria bacterium]|nr:MmcQ/YjbR family DNA-binding protein [Gammaproteobacteria bacterium]